MINFLYLNVDPKVNVAIHKNAFIDIVKSLQSTTENIQIINSKTDIEFVQSNKNIVFYLDVKIKKGTDISLTLEEIRSKLEVHSKLLINKKPFNIIINYIGSY